MNTKTLSIVGLVLSFVFPVAGIIVSVICLNKYKTENITDGKNLAMAGLIIGIVVTVLGIITSIVSFAILGAAANAMMQ